MLGLAVTDEAGKFAVALPEDARATLMAVHPYHIGRPIEVATGARTLGPTTVHPAGAIAGRVTDAATGKPVAGASSPRSLSSAADGGSPTAGARP